MTRRHAHSLQATLPTPLDIPHPSKSRPLIQIVTALLIGAIMATLLVSVYLNGRLKESAENHWLKEHNPLVLSLANRIDREIGLVEEKLSLLAQSGEFQSLALAPDFLSKPHGIAKEREPAKRALLAKMLGQSRIISSIYVLTPAGEHYLAEPFRPSRHSRN